jgi:hypothetical protein
VPVGARLKKFKKMSISEKIVHSDTFHIQLYKEGVFWIAYEQSAYYFGLQKGYKPTKKWVKTVGREIVSVGFPSLATDIEGLLLERDEPNQKTFILEEAIDMDAFNRWKDDLHLQGQYRKSK